MGVKVATADVIGPPASSTNSLGSDFLPEGAPNGAARAGPPAPRNGFVSVPVLAVEDQTRDIRSFRLARPSGFDFRAGQYLTLGFRVGEEVVSRCFSITSAPHSGGYVEIAVKRRGPVSSALCDTLGVESLVSVRPPMGSFVYPDGDRPLLLLAGGVGLTPFMSMLRHSDVRDPARRITCLLSVRTEKDLPFREELARLRRLHAGLRIGVTLTRERHPGLNAGRIGEALLRRAVPDPASTLVLVCAPAPMAERMRNLLAGLGVSAGQIQCESFDPGIARARAESGPPTLPRLRAATPALARSPSGAALPDRTPPPAPATTVARAPVPDPGKAKAPPPAQTVPFARRDQFRQILRFAKGEMMLHWAIAVPFMVCFASGITMKIFYNLRDQSALRDALSLAHRIGGIALAVLPALAVARNWRDYKVLIENVKIGFTWTIDDLKWLFLVGPSTVSRRIVLPDQRKFNAAERLNFMMVVVTYPLFVATGILLWIEGGHHFLPWVVHISMSLTAPVLMFGHIYMAVVNPSTRVGLSGMFTGRVDREWAKHHYARWYRENFEEDGTPKKK